MADLKYKKRYLSKRLAECANIFPVIVLSGARQTGKSTLIQNEEPFCNWQYVTLDDIDALSMAIKKPDDLVNLSKNLVIDEVQKAPKIINSIKKAIDKDKSRRILLSGSARILLMKQVSESLAGRAIYFDLLPFSIGEYFEKPFVNWLDHLFETSSLPVNQLSCILPTKITLSKLLYKGMMPPLFALDDESYIRTWWQSYIKTYLERDLRDVSEISNLPDFKKMMELLSLRNASILKQSEVARDCKISQATCGRYINTLEETSLITRVKPYSKNISKRLMKSPKIVFTDTGLCTSLAGYKSSEEIENEFLGKLFESLVYLNVKTYAEFSDAEIMYLRTMGGKEKEIDFIIEKGRKIIGVEVKFSRTISYQDIENILFLKNETANFVSGLLVYDGKEVIKLADKIYAIPWYIL